MNNYEVVVELIKISFIFNMIRDGWKFKYLGNNTMEFTKNRDLCGNINLTKLIKKNIA